MDIGKQNPQVILQILQNILGSTDDLISLLDEQGTFLYVNKVVSGLTMEQVIGAKVISFIPEKDKAIVSSAIEQCVSTNKPISYETAGVGPDDTEAYYFCRLSPCTLGDKKAVLCIGTDISSYKNAEKELHARIEELEMVNRATLDREGKMIELKKEIDELKNRKST